MRLPLALVLFGACGFSVPSHEVPMPDAPPDSLVPVTWAVDATSGKPVPANVTEWRDFLRAKGLTHITVPSGLWLLQEPSGSVADSLGTVFLAPFAGPSYQISIPGWTRKAVGTTDGLMMGFANMSDSTLPNVGSSSMTVLALMDLPATPPSAPRTFLVAGSSSPLAYAHADLDPSKHLNMAINVTSATGSMDPGAAPAGVMMKLDVTNGEQRLITRKETITLATTPLGGSRGLFFGGAVNAAPQAHLLYLVAWYGSKAEFSDADAKALLTALDW